MTSAVSVEELSEDSLLGALADLLEQKEQLTAEVKTRAASLKQQNQLMWQRLYRAIGWN